MRENIIESVNTCTNIENLDENEHVFIYILCRNIKYYH